MFKNYFKVALRNLYWHKEFAFVNIVGLTVGLACSILIFLWVWDELSFDQFNEQNENIYRVVSDWEKWDWDGLPISPGPLGPALAENINEVKNMFRIIEFDKAVFKYEDNVFYENRGIIVDPGIFSIFSFAFKKGNHKTALSTPESIVLSEKFTQKYFGSKDPIGQFIEVNGKLRTVTGVFFNIPKNSHIQFDFAVNIKFLNEYSNSGTGWNAFNFTTYLLLDKKEFRNIALISDVITQVALSNECSQVKSGVVFRLQPLKDIHLDPTGRKSNYTVIGDKSHVFVFTLIAVFILLIACINFMNLSTARSINRAKEVGLRKTVGAMKRQLILQFLSESILVASLSIIFAMILVEFALPTFNELSGKTISTDYSNPIFLLSLITVILFTGLLAGSYPALYLSSFNPVKTFQKGYKTGKGSSTFRKILVVFQFSLSTALIFISIIIYQQVEYSKNMKLGYNKENLIYIPLIDNLVTQHEVMKNNLLKNTLIRNVSSHEFNFVSDPTPRTSGFMWESMNENREKNLDLILSGVDYNFFETLDIELVEGRNFSKIYSTDKDGVVLNEAALDDMKLKSPLGKWISLGNWKGTIIGVAKNIHFRSSRQVIEPRIYYLSDYTESRSGIMLIKINGTKTSEAIAFVQSEWNRINPASPFEYEFIDEDYNNLYKSENQVLTIFKYFTTVAIFISCLGLFGLSLFSAEQRRKEIGIRKVLGASISEIVVLFTKDFAKWVLIANIIAWPIAYYFMNEWLLNFAYKVDLNIVPFVIAGFSTLIIAMLTVSSQAIKTSLTNPIESLRSE